MLNLFLFITRVWFCLFRLTTYLDALPPLVQALISFVSITSNSVFPKTSVLGFEAPSSVLWPHCGARKDGHPHMLASQIYPLPLTSTALTTVRHSVYLLVALTKVNYFPNHSSSLLKYTPPSSLAVLVAVSTWIIITEMQINLFHCLMVPIALQ